MIAGQESGQPHLILPSAAAADCHLRRLPDPGVGLRQLILKILRQIIFKMTRRAASLAEEQLNLLEESATGRLML
jgi:hypothetical protein